MCIKEKSLELYVQILLELCIDFSNLFSSLGVKNDMIICCVSWTCSPVP